MTSCNHCGGPADLHGDWANFYGVWHGCLCFDCAGALEESSLIYARFTVLDESW